MEGDAALVVDCLWSESRPVTKKMTTLHYVLKKGSDKKYVRMLIKYGARGDLKNGSGVTAAEILRRKRDPEFREMATQLAGS